MRLTKPAFRSFSSGISFCFVFSFIHSLPVVFLVRGAILQREKFHVIHVNIRHMLTQVIKRSTIIIIFIIIVTKLLSWRQLKTFFFKRHIKSRLHFYWRSFKHSNLNGNWSDSSEVWLSFYLLQFLCSSINIEMRYAFERIQIITDNNINNKTTAKIANYDKYIIFSIKDKLIYACFFFHFYKYSNDHLINTI